MYTLVVVTKKSGKVVKSYDAQFRSVLKFKAFDLLTKYRLAVIFNEEGEVDLIYELNDKGVPEEVTNKYDIQVEYKEVV